MSKPKIRVSKQEVTKDIRAGVDDAALMNKYGISARGLQSLFKKLLAAGLIDKSEIDLRIVSPQWSHVVELVSIPGQSPRKTAVNPAEAVRTIRSGLSEATLMEKYKLSARGLESLFSKLAAAGHIKQAELDAKRRSFDSTDLAFMEGLDRAPEPESNSGSNVSGGVSRIARLVEDYKIHLAAVAGALVGMLALAAFLLMMNGIDRPLFRASRSSGIPADVAGNALQREARETIKILEAIERNAYAGLDPESVSTVSAYRECLRSCEDGFEGIGMADRGEAANCRKSCIHQYSERFRAIRERYYGSALPM